MKKIVLFYKKFMNITACFGCSVLMLFSACNNVVDFGEQYKKTVYIVNSGELLYTWEHFFETENDAIVISVYCASSEPITSDLRAILKIEPQALDCLISPKMSTGIGAV